MTTSASSPWTDTVRLYANRRQLAVLLMGFSSGLPLLLGFSTLSYWLAKEEVSLAAIGTLLTVATPYSLKFLWAPALDHLPPPPLFRRLGRRRGWLLFIQLILIVAIVALGAGNPSISLGYVALMAVAMAFVSASQDIVVDAYRIEILAESEQGPGASVTQIGYRAGMLVAGAGAIALSDYIAWFWVYLAMAALVAIGIVGTLLGPEPDQYREPATPASRAEWWRRVVAEPFADFTRHRGWVAILVFVLLYKYGDAVAGAMANPFYVALGFSGGEIASVTKVFGVVATLAGVFAGGLLTARAGVFPALLIAGILQAVTNLIFAWLAWTGKDIELLTLAIGADGFTGGMGTAAFVAYLSGLCNVAFTGTQYALLTSLAAVARTGLAAVSGFMVEEIGWVGFFVATTGLAVPGLLLLIWIARLNDREDLEKPT